MLTLYTEKQLMRAYKVFIIKYCSSHYTTPPDLEIFRTMFEKDEDLQDLALETVLDNWWVCLWQKRKRIQWHY